MERRTFIKLGTLSSLAMLLPACSRSYQFKEYDVVMMSDSSTGHLVRSSYSFPRQAPIHKDVVIVGGGVAGLSAASYLKDRDIMVCELSAQLGGSSASHEYNGQVFSQGAHYDLAYPAYYGKAVLAKLKELNIIIFNEYSQLWEFVDKQFVIESSKESRSLVNGDFREDVLPSGPEKQFFLGLISQFLGKMTMPSTEIEEELRYLNDVSFLDYLKEQKAMLSEEFVLALDYMVKDDFGAGCSVVSALAGIHYFMCRPYYIQEVELFSPPEGNNYFVNKLAETLKSEQLATQHLVSSIRFGDDGFEVEIIDVQAKEVKVVQSEKVIYAGQKHALKYIYPADKKLFSENVYAPWVVVNVVLNKSVESNVFWQNEIVGENRRFLGFVDSRSQFSENDAYVLTAYFCYELDEREKLLEIEKTPQKIVNETINTISSYFDEDISELVEKVFVKPLGHAIPVPTVGYLFNDKNEKRNNPNLVYAGVDNSRLPLFFEAMDSGIRAAQLV